MNVSWRKYVRYVRLIMDECFGQNKSCTVLTMCLKWLCAVPLNVKQLDIFSPVTGHFFMPPDGVFGAIKQKIKKFDEIIKPQNSMVFVKN